MSGASTSYPEIVANGALALIAVAASLLDRQIAAQARAFEAEGGFTERLYRVRSARRRRPSGPDPAPGRTPPRTGPDDGSRTG